VNCPPQFSALLVKLVVRMEIAYVQMNMRIVEKATGPCCIFKTPFSTPRDGAERLIQPRWSTFA